jgi:hypothetical protein
MGSKMVIKLASIKGGKDCLAQSLLFFFGGAISYFRLACSFSSFFGPFVPHLEPLQFHILNYLCSDAHDSVTISCINIFPFLLYLFMSCVCSSDNFFLSVFFSFFGLSLCFVFSASEYSEFSEFSVHLFDLYFLSLSCSLFFSSLFHASWGYLVFPSSFLASERFGLLFLFLSRSIIFVLFLFPRTGSTFHSKQRNRTSFHI